MVLYIFRGNFTKELQMSVSSLLKSMRPDGTWTKHARMIYSARRLISFFEKYPSLALIAAGNDPYNRVLWDGIYRFFYRSFPVKTSTYSESNTIVLKPWWYNDELGDPRWDKLIREYGIVIVYEHIVRVRLKKSEL